MFQLPAGAALGNEYGFANGQCLTTGITFDTCNHKTVKSGEHTYCCEFDATTKKCFAQSTPDNPTCTVQQGVPRGMENPQCQQPMPVCENSGTRICQTNNNWSDCSNAGQNCTINCPTDGCGNGTDCAEKKWADYPDTASGNYNSNGHCTAACQPVCSLNIDSRCVTCTPTNPPTEVCDGIDNDCDGQIDNGAICFPTTCPTNSF